MTVQDLIDDLSSLDRTKPIRVNGIADWTYHDIDSICDGRQTCPSSTGYVIYLRDLKKPVEPRPTCEDCEDCENHK